MSNQSTETAALKEAMGLMGEFAWPTLLLGGLSLALFALTPIAVLQLSLSVWLGVILMALAVYGMYTVMHDSVHGAIAGRHRRWLWVNSAVGYLAAQVLTIPYTAHRYEHISHHRYTNDPHKDPDYQVSAMTGTPWSLVKTGGKMIWGNYRYYWQHRWPRTDERERMIFITEVSLMVLLRVACLVWFGSEAWQALVLLVVGPAIGTVVLTYLFAYLVHRPHTEQGRFRDTSTIELPGVFNTPLTWAWLFQNYHSIHHLYPKVPFFRYRQLFERLEPLMRARGAPIYLLTWSGLESSVDSQARQPKTGC